MSMSNESRCRHALLLLIGREARDDAGLFSSSCMSLNDDVPCSLLYLAE